MTVAKLILSRRLSFELLLHDAIVGLLFAGSHAVKVGRRWLILANWFLNVERIDLLNEFKLGLGHLQIHSQVQIVFDLLKGHRWRSLRLLDLGRDPRVFFSVYTLVLNQIVEPGLVGPDAQILLDVILFLFKLVLVETVEYFVWFGAFFVR